MGNFFGWTLVYAVKALILAAVAVGGVFLGKALRVRKDAKQNDKQEAVK